MIRVEIIGSAGVGKTTLLHRLKRIRNNKDWITSKKALCNVVFKIDIGFLRKVFLFFCVKFFYNKGGFFRIMNFFPDTEYYKAIIKEDFEILNEILCSKVRSERHLPFRRLNSIIYYLMLIKEYALISEFIKNQVVVFDESIIRRTSLDVIDTIYHQHLNSFILPTAVIFLNGNITLITKNQRRKRSLQKGFILSEQEVEKSIDNTLRKVELLNKIGVPNITLDASNIDFKKCDFVSNIWIPSLRDL